MISGINCKTLEKTVSFENCLKCAKTLKNKCQFTQEVVSIILGDLQQDDKLNLRTTNLLDCPRCVYLESTREYPIALEDFYAAFRGRMIHSIMEAANPDRGAIIEKKFFKKLGEFTFHGTPDKILPKKKFLRDYKTVKELPRFNSPYSSHINQVNIYRWILYPEIEIDDAEVVYISMSDMKRIKMPKEKMYSFNDIEKAINEKASILSQAFKTGVIPPVAEGYPKYWKCKSWCNVADICFNEFRNGR